MPELPEVETMRRGIAAVAGCRIDGLRRPRSRLQSIQIDPPLADFRRRAVGRRIESVGRVGKRIVLELDSGDRIVLEPRMTGLVLLADPPDAATCGVIVRLVLPIFPGGGRRAEIALLGPARAGRGAAGFSPLSSPALRPGPAGPRRPRRFPPPCCGSGLAGQPPRRSRWPCWTSGPWRASATSTPRKSSTARESIPPCPAGGCGRHNGPPCTPPSERFSGRPSATRARPSATAPTASPATSRETTSIATGSISGPASAACVAAGAKSLRIVQCQRSTFFCPACQAKRGGD